MTALPTATLSSATLDDDSLTEGADSFTEGADSLTEGVDSLTEAADPLDELNLIAGADVLVEDCLVAADDILIAGFFAADFFDASFLKGPIFFHHPFSFSLISSILLFPIKL